MLNKEFWVLSPESYIHIYIYISIFPDLIFKDVLRTYMYMFVDIYSLP